MSTDQIIHVPRASVHTSTLNPRKHFDDTYIDELAQNIRQIGFINALIVRPNRVVPSDYEIIAGECRWRASGVRPTVNLPALTTLPVIVRDLPDHIVLEMMLSENMQRKDLSALEEMDAFLRMLEQQNGEGAKLYSAETLAEKIGVSPTYVYHRCALRKLSPVGRKALAEGRISFVTARVICGCPAAVVPLVEDEVINPKKYRPYSTSSAPLSAEETQDLVRSKYVRTLANAPFPLASENLVPVHVGEHGERMEGGACTDCPWNSVNAGHEEKKVKKSCLNPSCFSKKSEIFLQAQLVKAKDEGLTILSEKEAEKAIYENGSLPHNSSYVRLDQQPDASDLSHQAQAKGKVPSWKKMLEGSETQPDVVIAVRGGRIFKLVKRKDAIIAAQESGTAEKYLSASAGKGYSQQDADLEASRKAEKLKQKIRSAQAREICLELVHRFIGWALGAGGEPAVELLVAMYPLAKAHAQHAGCTFVAKRRDLKATATGQGTVHELVAQHASSLQGEQLAALTIELLAAQFFAWVDSPNIATDPCPEAVRPLAEALGVNVAEVKRRVAADLKAADGGKKKKPADPEKGQPAEGGKEGSAQDFPPLDFGDPELVTSAEAIVKAIATFGEKGVAVRNLADELGVPTKHLAVWIATTGSKHPNIRREQSGRIPVYCFVPSEGGVK